MNPTRLWLTAAMAAGCVGSAPDEQHDDADPAAWALAGTQDPRIAELLATLSADLAAAGVPGGAISIVEHGRLIYAGGVGVRAAGGSREIDADTVFRIASTTKPVTAATLVRLADRGLIDLDAPITRAIPELQLYPGHAPSEISALELLAHTAGIADGFEISCEASLAEWLANRPTLTQYAPSGLFWNYSNLGFTIAGRAIEKVGGGAYAAIVERELLAPAAMRTATFDPDVVVARDNFAVGASADPTTDTTLARCAGTDPYGYMYASAVDLARFAQALLPRWLPRGPLPAPVISRMLTPETVTNLFPQLYGTGMFFELYKGELLVGHAGDLPGFHIAWYMVPSRRFAISVLVNGDGYAPTALVVDALDRFLALPDIPPLDTRTPPTLWTQYTGTYDDPEEPGAFPPSWLGQTVVSLEGDQLFVDFVEAGQRFELLPIALDTFVLGGVGLPLSFERDATGQVAYAATRIGVATRAAPARRLSSPARATAFTAMLEAAARQDRHHATLAARRGGAAEAP